MRTFLLMRYGFWLYLYMSAELIAVKDVLTRLKPDLVKRYPIASIGLFGSIVRDDFTAESDVDIIVDFNDRIGIEFVTLADELEAKLNYKVDLVSRGGIKQKYLDMIDPQIIYVWALPKVFDRRYSW